MTIFKNDNVTINFSTTVFMLSTISKIDLSCNGPSLQNINHINNDYFIFHTPTPKFYYITIQASKISLKI